MAYQKRTDTSKQDAINETTPIASRIADDSRSDIVGTDRTIYLSRSLWATHFILCFVVLIAGILYNGGTTKFTSMDEESIPGECSKAYVNVIASTAEEPGAILCCDESTSTPLCSEKFPPLYKQLTRLPGAFLIPLIPFLMREIVVEWEYRQTNIRTEKLTTSLWRLGFYVVIMFLRGSVLYLGMDFLETRVIKSPTSSCWFEALTGDCETSQFDGSDHTVLYLGQILALTVCEIAHIFGTYHWNGTWKTCVLLLSFYVLYLYAITFFGFFQTAAYYHTGPEMLMGYLVSLIIQIPLAILQCTTVWDGLRGKLFG